MKRLIASAALTVTLVLPALGAEAEIIKPIDTRYADRQTQEVPDFRRHVIPMMSRLGCNGRSCHGSFQGRGGFRLSLFGHDFDADHEALLGGDEPRVNVKDPQESLIIQKPTDGFFHEGGQRYKPDSWQHHVFLRWIESGAKNVADDAAEFVKLEVTPGEIIFHGSGEQQQLKAVAVWSDGTREEVTPLCRFQSNSDTNADIDPGGLVTAGEPGDTHVVVFYDRGVVPIPVLQPVTERVGNKYPDVPTPTKIDELVVQKLRKLGIVPSELSTDAEFLRRLRLDMTGTLPTAQEVEDFLADSSPDKRKKKIDELLETPEYAAWWTTRLCDFTGNSDDALVNVVPGRVRPASQDWYEWIHKRVSENVPYDELVAGIVLADSRREEESFEEFSQRMSSIYREDSKASFADLESMPHYWARRTFRQPEERVIGFAYTFLGIRIQCAQCHKHPFDQWTQDDFKAFTPFLTATRFGNNPQTRDEYQAMIEKLGLDDLRGGQLRRELGQKLEDGETVPFQEVYTTQARRPSNNNFRRIARTVQRLNEQIEQAEKRINELKEDNKTKQAEAQEETLKRLQTRLNRAKRRQQNAERNSRNDENTARVLGGEDLDLSKFDDPRQPLMDWLRSKDNTYFARAFVNRVWAAYFNVGIVDPSDDLSLANPPSNRALFDYLAEGFIESGFDMKWLHREITGSRTYQLSWVPNETNVNDERNFSHSVPRRLEAEVAYDAIKQATLSDEEIAKLYDDLSERAIAIPGAGRRNRRARDAAYALTVFGRSTRDNNCDCDRSVEASLLQTVYLQNDQDVLNLINNPRDGWLASVMGRSQQRSNKSAAQGRETNGKLANLRKQLAANRQRLEKLKKADSEKAQQNAQRLARRQAALRKQVEQLTEELKEQRAEVQNGGQVAALDTSDLIRQAYLRTLSRYPSEEELARSSKYIEQSEDTLQGLRDVLWALINTKEFIVNH